METSNYLKKVVYKKPKQQDFPFNLSALNDLNDLVFDQPLTFFVGENGTGKSTVIEMIASLMGMNMEGGSRNQLFSTYEENYSLADACRPVRYPSYPKDFYFYRAESFYNLMTEIEETDAFGPSVFERDLHSYSRGESFVELLTNRFFGKGFYLLDEPETGLSLSTQLQVMVLLKDLIGADSQFIIATHSPVLLFFPNAKIYEFSADSIQEKKLKETRIYQDWSMIFEREQYFFEKLLSE
ncbi:AAA family ATPase [Enterococcus sp. LJL51]|uniref:AAA family ATPase n=1 Tax=Enterococcus sp. LJL51 TaxID=3416656 RepID=UPI003CF483A2